MTRWHVIAQGPAVRHLETNVTPESRDPDLEWPDPVPPVCRFRKGRVLCARERYARRVRRVHLRVP